MSSEGRPRVSVVIPAYNQERFVGACLQSALAQTESALEIIVVDDGSTDGTSEVLKGFGPPVQVIHQTNAGVAVARNVGAAAATGDLLAFLDADDVWMPDKLMEQVDRLVADPSLGLVHCGLIEIDADGNHGREQVDGLDGWVQQEYLRLRRTVVVAGSSTAMVPRTLFEEIGGFDTAMSYAADWDLCYRIASTHPIAFVAQPLLGYRVHGANMTGNVQALGDDMTRALEKAGAATTDPVIHRLVAEAYGRLDLMLAGAWLGRGDRGRAFHHLMRSVRNDPRNLAYAVALPARRLRRSLACER
jgi:glycosyltransferase involved in cell wall biosynthesis